MLSLYIFIGGGLGSLSRYAIGLLLSSESRMLPLGTLVANILGCVLLGYLLASPFVSEKMSASVRMGLGTGFLGGFTTFSTFSVESIKLFQAGEFVTVFCYTGASVLGGLAAAYVGMRLAAG